MTLGPEAQPLSDYPLCLRLPSSRDAGRPFSRLETKCVFSNIGTGFISISPR